MSLASQALPKPKTHNTRRRPAMIPADALADLTSEDKAAIRLRTGRYPVIFHPAAAAAVAAAASTGTCEKDAKKPGGGGLVVTERELDVRNEMMEMQRDIEMRKRKASTTSEVYRERCGEAKEGQGREQGKS